MRILGKGRKERHCPLWPTTLRELTPLTNCRSPAERVFLNRCGHPITRFGIHTLVERYVLQAQAQMPSLQKKRVSPHCIRHTTATHLLRSGVDINTVRAWLGHVSLNTTNIYAEIDLEMKAKALAKCEIPDQTGSKKPWREDPDLRTGAKIISQIWSNRVVPSRNYFVRSEAQGRDQLWVGLEMGLILVSVEIGGHDQASFGAGGANEFEHFGICFPPRIGANTASTARAPGCELRGETGRQTLTLAGIGDRLYYLYYL